MSSLSSSKPYGSPSEADIQLPAGVEARIRAEMIQAIQEAINEYQTKSGFVVGTIVMQPVIKASHDELTKWPEVYQVSVDHPIIRKVQP